ncbi:hypothetical protein LB518_00685 [Mesorhizobium sp. BR1-1-16]|uniref:hypothetical protein n=1 Tax=Mesorhizobium sp. BR1-1-16 TaxID=2876653 RepID=UPI001CCE9CEC|nr:hypothetical protein [Mesorhizobium sp. BR1-1-16]MBZ9934794.1 hypothetical protein [Mesorhizobium sp. BR1-1-16]
MVADLERDRGNEPAPMIEDGVRLTPEQLRRRRARSIAIGLALGALVILFWAVTIVKLGGNVANRSL